jgi:hypothetical protein
MFQLIPQMAAHLQRVHLIQRRLIQVLNFLQILVGKCRKLI